MAGHDGLQAAHSESGTAAEEGAFESAAADSELSGIHGYYAGLIAAARGSLKGLDAAAMIRRLKNEKILAVRAAKERRHATRANRPKAMRSNRANRPPVALNT